LDIERFGKNVIINVEDSSPPEQQLVKYEEQRLALRDKRAAIERKLKHRLEEGFKFRSKSHFAIRQQLIEEYASPIKVPLLSLSSHTNSPPPLPSQASGKSRQRK
jgi:hypothetical protein